MREQSDSHDMFDISNLFDDNVLEGAGVKVYKRELEMTDSTTVARVYKLAREVSAILKENNVLFWTSGGTTLGICRHRGLIPWDDDIDFCIRQEDLENLLLLSPVLEEGGYKLVQSSPYLWKIFHLTESSEVEGRNVSYRYPFCDVFLMARRGARLVVGDRAGETAWPEEWYSLEQIEELSWEQFADFSLPCPASPHLYLSRYRDQVETRLVISISPNQSLTMRGCLLLLLLPLSWQRREEAYLPVLVELGEVARLEQSHQHAPLIVPAIVASRVSGSEVVTVWFYFSRTGNLIVYCRMYGEDWRTVGATLSLSHHNRDIVTPTYFSLQESHYSPAKPFH